MTRRDFNPTLVAGAFIIQVLLNWAYVLWIKKLFEEVVTAWFLIVPLFGYFYFTFAIIALAFICQKKRLGLALACFVLIFGLIIDVVSYGSVFKLSGLYELFIIPLIVLNCLMLLFVVSCKSGFKDE